MAITHKVTDETRSRVTRLVAATAVGTASACTSIHTRSSASASLDGVTYDQAFRVTTQAAMDAGF